MPVMRVRVRARGGRILIPESGSLRSAADKRGWIGRNPIVVYYRALARSHAQDHAHTQAGRLM